MRKRNRSVLIRVSNDEFELINTKATKDNMNRNDYIINRLITPPIIVGETLKGVLSELKQLKSILDCSPYKASTEGEKQALLNTELLIGKIYQEVYLIARKGVI